MTVAPGGGGVVVWLYSGLISAVSGGWVFSITPRPLAFREKNHCTECRGGGVGPKAVVDGYGGEGIVTSGGVRTLNSLSYSESVTV
jgi:hypothetical protein